MKTIIATHLYNDLSGSPRVFRQALQALSDKGHKVHLYTSQSEKGFLNDLEFTENFFYPYKWSESRFYTLYQFIITQLGLFIKLFRYRKTDVEFYINTVLPFGFALAAWIMRKKVIYHVHEVSVKPRLLKLFLFGVMKLSAHKIIYVSDYLKDAVPFSGNDEVVIPNALSNDFFEDAATYKTQGLIPKSILMICSLKAYKGINEFIMLAQKLGQYTFRLVLNAERDAINDYFNGVDLPENLELYPAQKNLFAFYRETGMVLNMSIPGEWNETFGLTALEAMAYGKPVIVPPAGGIAELVNDCHNGYCIHPKNIGLMAEAIDTVYRVKGLYQFLAENARINVERYTEKRFSKRLLKAFG